VKLISKRIFIACIGSIVLIVTGAVNAADTKLKTDKEKFSYAVGFQVGGGIKQNIKQNNIDIDTNIMLKAITDVLNDKTPAVPVDEMRAVLEQEQKKALALLKARAEQAKAIGKKFLIENGKKDGVITRDSGLQYKVISSGKGPQAKAEGSITAHYEGTLIDGKVFDSSYRRGKPATFNLNQVIKGWQEVIPLMHEGDKWKVFIPSELAYGERGQGPVIGPNETLIFDIELVKVN